MTDHHFITPTNGLDGRPRVAQPPASDYSLHETPQDDDGQISCFCGIEEDDGNTVACDSCNRWQHIRCYYPEHANGQLPEDLQHFCVDCHPRAFDAQAANQRQREARGHKDSLKRPGSKGNKKKPNGWPRDHTSSPKEGPPPKRPKTSHKSSNSTQLKRNALATPELARTYSADFIQTYRNDEYTIPTSNCLNNLTIGVKMRDWLCNADELYRISKMSPPDLFLRFDADISSIDLQMDLISIREVSDDRFKLADGTSPTWKYVTLKESLSTQACIGELRGHIGLKEDYEADPANKWNVLRHPAPFVFYHPHLPLCVDARTEGTVVRYVRRSCSPNAELKIIITDDSDYHFCFIATRDIEAGEEVAIAWDSARSLAETVSARSSDAFSRTDLESVQQWVSTVLYHCGPCACDRTDCYMARFDKRPDIDFTEPAKPSKRRKKQHISPLNTTTNSRSGSEVRKIDDDDSRSASASTGKESASRDITPNTTYTANGMSELSERERKKLAKEEEIFKRQEAEAHGKQLKSRKRASGGGTKANSPAEKRSRTAARPSVSKSAESARSRAPIVVGAKPTYVDSAIQCDMDADEAEQRRIAVLANRKPRWSMHRRLLERCTESNKMWLASRQSIRHDHPPDPPSPGPKDDHTVTIISYDASPQQQTTNLPAIDAPTNDTPTVNDPIHVKQEEPSTTPLLTSNNSTFEFVKPLLNGNSNHIHKSMLNGSILESTALQSPAGLIPAENLLSPPMPSAGAPNTPVRKKLSLSEYSKQRKAKETEAKSDRDGDKDRDSSPTSFVSITQATSLDAIAEQVNKDDVLQPVVEDATMEDAGVAAGQ